MNNLSLYFGLVDAKNRASDKDLRVSKMISVIVEKICHSFMAMSRLFGVLSFKNAVMNDALMTLVTLFSGSSVTFEVNR